MKNAASFAKTLFAIRIVIEDAWVAGITKPVVVLIVLREIWIPIWNLGAVVAHIADSVLVSIRLVRISVLKAVVNPVHQAVSITVQKRIAIRIR